MFFTTVGVRLGLREWPVSVNDIEWNAEQRTLLIKKRSIRLTPIQYRLMAPLQCGKPVTYAELAHSVYHCPVDETVRKTMDKQIDRIRIKLHGTGLYIYCINRYGYMLLNEVLPENENKRINE